MKFSICRLSIGSISYRIPFHKLHFVNKFIDIALSHIDDLAQDSSDPRVR